MGSVTISWPSQYDQRVIDGIAYYYGYQDMVGDPEDPGGDLIPNPETKPQFCKRMVQRWAKECVKAWEVQQATEPVRQQASADAEEIEIT